MPHGSKQEFCNQPQNGINGTCSPLPSICSLVSNITPKDFVGHKGTQPPRETVESKPKPPKSKIWSLADTATNNKTNFNDETSGSNTGTSHILHHLTIPACSPYGHHYTTNYSPYPVRGPLQTSFAHSLCRPRTISGVRHDTQPQLPQSVFNSYGSIQLPNFIGNISPREAFAMKESTTDSQQQTDLSSKILDDGQHN